jgi:uncharacterized protein (DUF3820 family)
MFAVINPISANQDLDPQTPVPFGKYKGRPVIEMMADTNYVDWLMTQDWFAGKYQVVFNIITGYNGNAAETPEHNSLQVKFLEPEVWTTILKTPAIHANLEGRFEDRLGGDCYWAGYSLKEAKEKLDRCHSYTSDEDRQAAIDKVAEVELKLAESEKVREELTGKFGDQQMTIVLEKVEFENSGCDVLGTVGVRVVTSHFTWGVNLTIAVEIKPGVSDDYPAILRQMLAMNLRLDNSFTKDRFGYRHYQVERRDFTVLYTQRVSAKGATPDQIRRIFESSGFTLVIDPPTEGGACD